ncbi:hypothetical protein C5S32_12960 [ANME-1 cluster archaeon GoMg1]|nr:hypothetical protein [ANME-1 cluster archaeon GoMg1]
MEMNMKHIKVASCIGLLLLCAFIGIASVTISGASVTGLNVNPQIVVQGETLSISGKASPNEEVWLKSSFVISLPVSDAKYAREFNDIHFPAGEKRFSVTAENIKDIRVSLGPIPILGFGTFKYPLEGPKKATNGIATLSISLPLSILGDTIDIEGKRNVKVYGAVADEATSVILTTGMSIKVNADSNGDFELDINTGGVPLGEFLITAGGIERTVKIVLTEPTPIPTSSPSPSPMPSPTSTPSSDGRDGGGKDGSGAPDTTPAPTPTPVITPTPTLSPMPTPLSTITPSVIVAPSPGPPSTPSPTPTPTVSPQPTPTPGFEAVFAIAGLLAVAYLVLRHRRKA